VIRRENLFLRPPLSRIVRVEEVLLVVAIVSPLPPLFEKKLPIYHGK